MRPSPAVWIRTAAFIGGSAVAFGAFAAHGASDARAAELLRTGALYSFVHALAVLAVTALERTGHLRMGWSKTLFAVGAVLFSGSLYALAFGAPKVFGAVTPFGGLAFILGWASVAWQARQTPEP
jgi:uncharacterized membrane protein YgdD (TMEM256/DUF423 family)